MRLEKFADSGCDHNRDAHGGGDMRLRKAVPPSSSGAGLDVGAPTEVAACS